MKTILSKLLVKFLLSKDMIKFIEDNKENDLSGIEITKRGGIRRTTCKKQK